MSFPTGGSNGVGGTPPGIALDQFLRNSYELVEEVHANLAQIRAVAEHLTPVEDLVEFQNEVTQLHAHLNVLVYASELIVASTPAGIAMMQAADAVAQRALLSLQSAALRPEEYFATAVGLQTTETAVLALQATVSQLLADVGTKASQEELDQLSAVVVETAGITSADIQGLRDQVALIAQKLGDGTFTESLVTQILNLTNRLDDIEDGLGIERTRITQLYSTVDAQADSAAVTAGVVQEVLSRITISEGKIEATSSDMLTLQSQVGTLTSGQAALATAQSGLMTRTSNAEGQLLSQAGSITVLGGQIADAINETSLQAAAISSLDTRMSTSEGKQTSLSTEQTALSNRILVAETGLVGLSEANQSLESRVEQTEQGMVISNEERTSLRASLTGSGNLVPNAGFSTSVRGWTLFSRGTGWESAILSRNLAPNSPNALPPGMNALSLTTIGTPSGNAGIRSDNIPVEDLGKYILSGYLATQNCTLRMEWRILDEEGEEIGFGLVGQANTPPRAKLSEWTRVAAPLEIPGDGRSLQVQLWVVNITGVPKIWFLRPMLEMRAGEQINPSPWADSTEGLETALATAMQTLSATVSGYDDTLTAISESQLELSSQVGALESAVINEIITSSNKDASFTSSINSMSSRLGTVEDGVEAATTATNSLGTRVTNAEGIVTAHSSQLTNLQSQVNALDADTGGSGAAISALDVRVTGTEQDIDSLTQSVVSLQSNVSTANKIYAQNTAPPTNGTNGNLWFKTDDGNKPFTLQDGVWVPRKYTGFNRIFVQGTAPIAENVNDLWIHTGDGNKPYRWTGTQWLDVSDTRTTANSTAIQSLTTRTTTAEGNISTQANQITALQSTVNNGSTGVVATANAVSSLTTRVVNTEGQLGSQASSINSLSTTVGNNTSSISQQAASINGLKSLWSVQLDVNNYISGLYAENNGTLSSITFRSDVFQIVPSTPSGERLEWSNNNLRIYDSNGVMRVRLGVF